MSSLIPERQLIISPVLAATIGLEEAVLLHTLTEYSQFSQPVHKHWHEVEHARLLELLPFWNQLELQRISRSLQDKGVILLASSNRPGVLRFAMNDDRNLAAPAPKPAAATSQRKLATPLAAQWQPDEDMLQLLALNHNIPRDFALSQLEDFVLYWRERGEASHAWSNKFRQHVLKEWRHQQQQQVSHQPTTEASELQQQWQPSPDALEILYRSGVSKEFIDEAVPEFVLYWRERGIVDTTWNSKFIAHIRRQWHKYSLALQHDYEPRQIPTNWQPSEDLFDIIKLANIDRRFAQELLPEFVLFWRDSGEIQRSWNSKFLQHVKYQWATRHNLGQDHAGQATHQAGGKTAESFIEKHTDRSWREGL
jgi:hypothetical protein